MFGIPSHFIEQIEIFVNSFMCANNLNHTEVLELPVVDGSADLVKIPTKIEAL